MNDKEILSHIEQLVEEEHRLYESHGGGGLNAGETQRLEELNVQLDRLYDLLRQRRAKREFGENPDTASIRSEKTVESYLQ